MKKLLLMAVLLPVCLLLYTPANAAGVGSANVKFGKPDSRNVDCAGKGICMLSFEEGGNGVSVDFTITPDIGDGFRTLNMQFNIQEMEVSDKEYLYKYFLTRRGNPRDNYSFDAPYTIKDPQLCGILRIEPGTVTIMPETESKIEKVFDSRIVIRYKIK